MPCTSSASAHAGTLIAAAAIQVRPVTAKATDADEQVAPEAAVGEHLGRLAEPGGIAAVRKPHSAGRVEEWQQQAVKDGDTPDSFILGRSPMGSVDAYWKAVNKWSRAVEAVTFRGFTEWMNLIPRKASVREQREAAPILDPARVLDRIPFRCSGSRSAGGSCGTPPR